MALSITQWPHVARIRRAVWLALAVCLGWSFCGSATAQANLGRYEAGETLQLSLNQFVTPVEIRVEINGVESPGPHLIRGTDLFVIVPSSLLGTRHDIRVYRIGAGEHEAIGAGLFETSGERSLMFGSVQTDLGVRSVNGTIRDISTGVVRLEFDNNGGQERGRLVASRGSNAGDEGEDPFSIDDIFLEFRRPVFGDDLFFRLGSSDIFSQSDILDTQSRRGVTLRFADPALTHDLSIFALQTATDPDLDNPLGLSDPDDRVVGFNGILQPQAFPGVRFDVIHFDGRARNLPTGGDGTTSGTGAAFSAALADGRGDLAIRFAETRWSDEATDGETTVGQAGEIEASWQFASSGGVQSFVLGATVNSVDVGFYSPLNPEFIRGETGAEVSLEFVDPAWQWRLEVGTAKTNTGGAASDPVDRMNRASATVLHDPGDFTGGFLNGTRFFGNLALETLDRAKTPPGAIEPQNNVLVQAAFGMEKVQPRYNWAWAITHTRVRDRSDHRSDEATTFVSGRLSLDPTSASSAQFFVRAGERRKDSARYDEAEASFLVSQEFGEGLWETTLEGGHLYSQDPEMEGGQFLTASVSRELSNKHRLVGEVNWGRDRYTPGDVTGEGWTIGLFLRSDFGFQR